MTTATIQITPRAFGNIAAAAMSHGCDVTTYLIRTATAKRPTPPAEQPAAAPAPQQPAPAAPVHQPAAAGSAGVFDNLLD